MPQWILNENNISSNYGKQGNGDSGGKEIGNALNNFHSFFV